MKRSDMTFGLELEVGDIHRETEIPPELGAWEYSETDVVNLLPPAELQCCDPLGLEPPYGGEINVRPAREPAEVAQKVSDLLEYFRKDGQRATMNCISHTHVHVHVPGLVDDIQRLRSLAQYISLHQHRAFEQIHAFRDHPDLEEVKKARTYLKWDGARPMPDWMVDNILNTKLCRNFDDFVLMHQCGKDGKSRGRPFRYGINTYSLRHIKTVEFRFFRHTMRPEEIHDCVEFARRFMIGALFSATARYPDTSDLSFPPFFFDIDQCRAWETTKWPSDRGEKKRTFVDV